MTVINTNSAALRSQNAGRLANKDLQVAMERLSTGKRINSAKDDAAGLAIAQSMTSQIKGMSQAVRNSNDGISLAQTAEGALTEVSNMLQRIRELAVQSSSGTLTDGTDRANLQAEVAELTSQINDTLTKTNFNGATLFKIGKPAVNGDSPTSSEAAPVRFSIQTGANAGDTVRIEIKALDFGSIVGTPASSDYTPGTPASADYDDNGTPADTTDDTGTAAVAGTGTAAVPGLSIATAASASNAITTIDDALKAVATSRATLGASQSRLESNVNNLTNNVASLSDAKSRIEDADFSVETTKLAKAQILSQASQAMLAQANQSQQGVMSLLR